MQVITRSAVILGLALLGACAGTGTKTAATRPDDLSDIPRTHAPGALKDPYHDNFNSVLWVQTSAENRALATQAFNQALRTLLAAKADPAFSALPAEEQGTVAAGAPLALITDIDETVLDSSAFNADMIQNPIDPGLTPAEARKQFDQRWLDFVAQREGIAIPGAVAFLKRAEAEGVKVFYITNRKDPEKQDTCKNLVQAGLPLDDCATQVLTRNDADGRPKEKGARRKVVAAKHRVVLLLGDNLGDFADGIYSSRESRDQIVDAHASWWGERWVVLPNPMYGSWEDALGNLEKDASNPTYGVDVQRLRQVKAKSLRGVDWWGNPTADKK